MMADTWQKDFEACSAIAQDLIEKVNERNKNVDQTSSNYTRLSADIKGGMRLLSSQLTQLKRLHARTVASSRLTQREAERRQGLLDGLTSKEKQIEEMFNDHTALVGRSGLLGSARATSRFHGDDDGDAEARAADMSFDDIRRYQQDMVAQQDEGLEALADVVARQKQMGLDIGREIDRQDEIIDDIHYRTETADQGIRRETEHIRSVMRRENAGNCALWITAILLFVAIIVVAAVPYNGKQ